MRSTSSEMSRPTFWKHGATYGSSRLIIYATRSGQTMCQKGLSDCLKTVGDFSGGTENLSCFFTSIFANGRFRTKKKVYYFQTCFFLARCGLTEIFLSENSYVKFCTWMYFQKVQEVSDWFSFASSDGASPSDGVSGYITLNCIGAVIRKNCIRAIPLEKRKMPTRSLCVSGFTIGINITKFKCGLNSLRTVGSFNLTNVHIIF